MQPDSVDKVVMAAACLHNFCQKKCGNNYLPPALVDHETDKYELVDGLWRHEVTPDGLGCTNVRKYQCEKVH